MRFKNFRRILEFFIIGLVFGITEDILAVLIATDAEFSWNIVWIVALIALPFAIVSELVVDRIHFDKIRRWWNKEMDKGLKTVDKSLKNANKVANSLGKVKKEKGKG